MVQLISVAGLLEKDSISRRIESMVGHRWVEHMEAFRHPSDKVYLLNMVNKILRADHVELDAT